MNQHEASHNGWVARVRYTLESVKFVVTLVVILSVACVAGTFLPQGAEVTGFLQKNPAATGRMELLGALGLTHVFSSWWFIGLLCVLAASVVACSARRMVTVRHSTGYARGRALGSLLAHISILLILAGGVIRGVWGEKGSIEFREGDTRAQFVTDRGVKPLPFGLHLAKFEIETYAADKSAAAPKESTVKAGENDGGSALLVTWPEKNLTATLPVKVGVEQVFGDFRITVQKYIPDFTVDTATHEVTSRSNLPHNPAILVAVNGPSYQNHHWLFANFPDFVIHSTEEHASGPSPLKMVYQNHSATTPPKQDEGSIKSFKSTLKVMEGDSVAQTRIIEVNSPFSYKGYTFYQSGYDPDDLSYTSLQVVKDPGVPVVYAGFTLMILGLFIVFYLNPWLQAPKKQS